LTRAAPRFLRRTRARGTAFRTAFGLASATSASSTGAAIPTSARGWLIAGTAARRFLSTTGCLLQTLRCGAGLLTDLPGCLRCLLAYLPSCLAEPSGGLACRLPDALAQLAQPLTEATERLPCAAGGLTDRTARTKRLSRRVAQSAERLAAPSGPRRRAFCLRRRRG
jgi:hypothetical protein